jgi:hypothetical protein
MRFSRGVVLAIGLSSLAGAAVALPTDPVPVTSAQSSSAASTPAAQSEDAPTRVLMTKDLASMVKRAKDAGFKPEIRNGEVWYCKKDIAVGSRLPNKRCANEAGLLTMLDHTQEQKDALRAINPTPGLKQ